MPPKTEANLGGVVIERKIGNMDEEIEHPVGDSCQRNDSESNGTLLRDETGDDGAE